MYVWKCQTAEERFKIVAATYHTLSVLNIIGFQNTHHKTNL